MSNNTLSFKGSCLQYSATGADFNLTSSKKWKGFYSLLSPRRKIDPFHLCACSCFYVLIGDALAHLGKICSKENFIYIYTHTHIFNLFKKTGTGDKCPSH